MVSGFGTHAPGLSLVMGGEGWGGGGGRERRLAARAFLFSLILRRAPCLRVFSVIGGKGPGHGRRGVSSWGYLGTICAEFTRNDLILALI